MATTTPAASQPSTWRGLDDFPLFCVHRVDRHGLHVDQEVSSLGLGRWKLDVDESFIAIDAPRLLKSDGTHV